MQAVVVSGVKGPWLLQDRAHPTAGPARFWCGCVPAEPWPWRKVVMNGIAVDEMSASGAAAGVQQLPGGRFRTMA